MPEKKKTRKTTKKRTKKSAARGARATKKETADEDAEAPPSETDAHPEVAEVVDTPTPPKKKRSRGGRRRKKTEPAPAPASDAAPEPTEVDTATEPAAPARPVNTDAFAALGLQEPILSALARLGFEAPSDIQRVLIPDALKGIDIIGQARTGTGKTAAFALPLLQQIEPGVAQQALVLAPTRELAAQVDKAVQDFSHGKDLRTALILGGRRINEQLQRLKQHPELIIGTPGRVLDLMKRGQLDISQVKFAVLDEVDRMLDIGFRDDIRRILRKIEADHQTIFVSATLDEEIRKLARAFMKEPIELNVSGDELTVENIEHGFVPVDPQQKFSNLLGYLKHEVPKLAIVFTNTKHAARRVAEKLRKEGINCQEIHGDLHQSKREKVMAKFRKSAIQVLVATDLASRGLDVMEVSHIVNYDAPADPAAYVHRIGRTARMGNRGYAVTFITREEGDLLTGIEMLLNKEVPQFTTPWHIPPALPEGPDHVEEPTPEDAPPSISTRYQETYKKDELLESIGVRPVRRTLGSRFRTTRRRR